MTEFQAQSVVDAINRMFAGNHFNICTVDDCMRVTGATRTSDYDSMRLYHCCNYSQMSREAKAFLFKATMENVTNVDDFPAVRLVTKSEEINAAVTIEHKSTSLLKRLFG